MILQAGMWFEMWLEAMLKKDKVINLYIDYYHEGWIEVIIFFLMIICGIIVAWEAYKIGGF